MYGRKSSSISPPLGARLNIRNAPGAAASASPSTRTAVSGTAPARAPVMSGSLPDSREIRSDLLGLPGKGEAGVLAAPQEHAHGGDPQARGQEGDEPEGREEHHDDHDADPCQPHGNDPRSERSQARGQDQS